MKSSLPTHSNPANNQLSVQGYYLKFTANLTAVNSPDNVIAQKAAIEVVNMQFAMTVPVAFESTNKIGSLIKSGADQDVFCMLENLVWLTSQTLNVKGNLNTFQALPIIQHIKTEYQELTIEEIALCFRNGCAGKYGPTMHRFDVEVAAGWLKSYYEGERWDYIEKRNTYSQPIVSHTEIINSFSEKKEGLSPKAKEMIREMKSNLSKIGSQDRPGTVNYFQRVKEKTFEFIKKVPTDELEKLIQKNEELRPIYWQQINRIIAEEIKEREKSNENQYGNDQTT